MSKLTGRLLGLGIFCASISPVLADEVQSTRTTQFDSGAGTVHSSAAVTTSDPLGTKQSVQSRTDKVAPDGISSESTNSTKTSNGFGTQEQSTAVKTKLSP